MSHSDLETLLEQQGRELMRQLLQAHLDWRAQTTPTTPVVGADGVERTHQRSGTRALETLLGTVQVTRDGLGARGRETLFPLDAALNLPTERYSFGIRRRAAAEATKGAFDEVVKILAVEVLGGPTYDFFHLPLRHRRARVRPPPMGDRGAGGSHP